MPTTRPLFQSFIGGEVAPEMLGRVGDPRVQSGLALARNIQITPQGVAYKRPGRRFLGKVIPGQTGAHRVISYQVSSEQTMGVELTTGTARFYTARGPQLFCRVRPVASVSVSDDTLTFAAPHGLLTDDRVRILELSGSGSIPGNTDEFISYFASIVDTHRIKLSTSSGSGAIVNISSTGSGTIVVTDSADTPVRYAEPRVVSAVNTTTNVVTFVADHHLNTGDRMFILTFVGSSTPFPPPDPIFARVINSTDITLHPTSADALAGTNTFDIASVTAPVSTNFVIRKFYAKTDLIYWPGTGKGFFYCRLSPNSVPNPVPDPASDGTHWYRLPTTGEYQIPTPYDNGDLFELTYDQDEDRLTIAHREYRPHILRRIGLSWSLDPVEFGPVLSAPVLSDGTIEPGFTVRVFAIDHTVTPTRFTLGSTGAAFSHPFVSGDIVYIDNSTGASSGLGTIALPIFARIFKIDDTRVELFNLLTGGSFNSGPATPSGNVRIRPSLLNVDVDTSYQVTAVDADSRESDPSNTVTIENNLFVDGAFNTVTWTAVAGASRYRVYKKKNGLFGLVGDVDATSTLEFKDDNIDPDLTFTLPLQDQSLDADFPSAVAHFEQRTCYGGTPLFPRDIWMTQTGTEDDLSFHIPILDTDRIRLPGSVSRRVAIRHLVGFGHLIVLTDGAELRVTPLNSDALTPASASVRPQSFVGANFVRPQLCNSTIVFAAARGGHVFEMGFRQEAGGFITNDLCLRASHLFDRFRLADSARLTSPQPLLWFVSSSGKLLGLTYVPEEQIGAWHQHDTDGAVESCTAVCDPQDADERLLMTTRRTINGVEERFVECTTEERLAGVDAFFVDAGLTFDGRQTAYSDRVSTVNMQLTGGIAWTPGETLKLVTDVPVFRREDVGGVAVVVFTAADGSQLRVTPTVFLDAQTMFVTIDKRVPAELRNTPTTNWSVARRSFAGFDHLEGKTIRGLADGAPFTAVVVGGGFTLTTHASVMHAGLGYSAEMRTTPLVASAEAAGQGQRKTNGRAVLPVLDTTSFLVGAEPTRLFPVRADQIVDGVARVPLEGQWTERGQITIRQDDPLPLTVLGIALEATLSL